MRVDVSDETSVRQIVDAIVDTYDTLDVLVNNAVIYPNALVMKVLVLKMTAADFRRALDINLHDAFKHGGVHSVGAVVELAGAGNLASPGKRL